jgi:hypothetical protein
MDLADMAASVINSMLASSGVGGDGRAGMTGAGGRQTEKLGCLGLGLMVVVIEELICGRD